jgi:hypothetical protein
LARQIIIEDLSCLKKKRHYYYEFADFGTINQVDFAADYPGRVSMTNHADESLRETLNGKEESI